MEGGHGFSIGYSNPWHKPQNLSQHKFIGSYFIPDDPRHPVRVQNENPEQDLLDEVTDLERAGNLYYFAVPSQGLYVVAPYWEGIDTAPELQQYKIVYSAKLGTVHTVAFFANAIGLAACFVLTALALL